jgi:hypothetical protein
MADCSTRSTARCAGDRVPAQHIARRLDTVRDSFRQGLKEAGFVEGQNVAIEFRFAEGRSDRLPDLAADLLRKPVDRNCREHSCGGCRQGCNHNSANRFHYGGRS